MAFVAVRDESLTYQSCPDTSSLSGRAFPATSAGYYEADSIRMV
jgi:hypothetical protein